MSNHDENKEKQVLHLMINNTCTNDCPLCCNKQYNVDKIPVVTLEDLDSVDTVCITGGAPLLQMNTCVHIIKNMIIEHNNIKNVFIYCNGYEIEIGSRHYRVPFITILTNMFPSVNFGLTISPKCKKDWISLQKYVKDIIPCFESNIVYCFNENDIKLANKVFKNLNVKIVERKWQEHFVPTPNTIFRRLPIWSIN